MSGSRLFNFRQGDRSEYLAQYLLSGLGLVSPIPRQEDIGFDFVCSVADQEKGSLTFNHQYLISVKSLSSPTIELEPPKDWDDSLPHIGWLFLLELPLILGVVDKAQSSIALYSTLPVWFIYYENPDCGSITLIPRVNSDDARNVDRPKRGTPITQKPDTFHYDVDVGHPITILREADLHDGKRIKEIKDRLRLALRFARLTILHTRIGVRHFYWFAETSADGSRFNPAFYYDDLPNDPEIQNRVFKEIAPTLVSLAMLYKSQKNSDLLLATGKLLNQAPASTIPDLIKKHLKEVFE